MPNIQPEITAFENAVYGGDVRDAIVDLANKLNDDLDEALTHELATVDTTLTQSGAGADAKVVGDRFADDEDDISDLQDDMTAANTAIATKANAADVTAALATKADATTVTNALALKADASAVNAALALKANKIDLVATGSISLGRVSGSTVGSDSTATGDNVTASAACSHAEGYYTTASGLYAHAEGVQSTASGGYGSHAEGNGSTASGQDSHAGGYSSSASGAHSFAHGWRANAAGECQAVFGRKNSPDPNGKYVFIVGNGDADSYGNAMTVDWEGNLFLGGDLLLKDRTTGDVYRLVLDDGSLTVEFYTP